MQDGVLDSADVLIHGHPVLRTLFRKRFLVVMRRREAIKIPGRADERIESIRLAFRRGFAFRAGYVDERIERFERRLSLVSQLGIDRQNHRQVFVRHGYGAALFAEDNRHRRPPVTLAGNPPVAQAKLYGCLTDVLGLQMLAHFLLGFVALETVKRTGLGHRPKLGHGFLQIVGIRIAVRRQDDHADGQVVFSGKLEIAVIVCGHGHDGAGAVIHQHEVGRPYGYRFSVQGIDGICSGKDSEFFAALAGAGDLVLTFNFFDERINFFFLFRSARERMGQRMFRCKDHEGCAVQRVRARCEHFDGFIRVFDLKVDFGACAFADPVGLHGQHLFRPALFQVFEALQQSIGVVGDFEKPAFLQFGDHLVVAAPTQTVDDLFVGEYGVAGFAPVDLGVFPVHETAFQELQEAPLVPLVIFRFAGGDFAIPVVTESETLDLLGHGLDIGVGPFVRVRLVLDRRVLRRHAERIPPDRMQHVKTLSST